MRVLIREIVSCYEHPLGRDDVVVHANNVYLYLSASMCLFPQNLGNYSQNNDFLPSSVKVQLADNSRVSFKTCGGLTGINRSVAGLENVPLYI